MNLGTLKVWFDRLSWHFSKFQLIMVAYLFFSKAGWSDWYLLVFPYLMVAVYLEKKHIIPQENTYMTRKNPEAMRYIKMIEEIHKEIVILKKKDECQ